jgi:hypothetical protein
LGYEFANKKQVTGENHYFFNILDIQVKNKDKWLPKAQILVITGVWAFLFCLTRCVLINISDLLTFLLTGAS